MVVIYTDIYLQRLWTVYEIAAFITMHPMHRLKVLSASISLTVFVGVVTSYLANIIAMLVEEKVGGGHTYSICICICSVAFAYCVRKHAWSIAKMQARITAFEVRDCKCAVEEDRPVVYENIAVLMRACGAVPMNGTDDEALDAFNALVKSVLPSAVKASIGEYGFRYQHLLLLSVVQALPRGLDMAACYHHMPALEFVNDCIGFSAMAFGAVPLGTLLLCLLANRRLQLYGFLNHAYVLASLLLSAALVVALMELVRISEASNAVLFYIVCLCCLVAPVAVDYHLNSAGLTRADQLAAQSPSLSRSRTSLDLASQDLV